MLAGDEAAPAEIPRLAPVPASAGDDDEAAGRELPAALGFLLHIEKFSARIKGKIANRIIIKGCKGFKCGCSKNKCFFHAMTETSSAFGNKTRSVSASKIFCQRGDFLLSVHNAAS